MSSSKTRSGRNLDPRGFPNRTPERALMDLPHEVERISFGTPCSCTRYARQAFWLQRTTPNDGLAILMKKGGMHPIVCIVSHPAYDLVLAPYPTAGAT